MPKVTGCKLTPAQIRILKALEGEACNRERLEEKAGFTLNPNNLGYLTAKPLGSSSSINDSESLIGQGLVAAKIDIDRDCVMLSLTKNGQKAAQSYSTNARISKKDRIPSGILDPAVLKIKPLRAYGFEQYTPDDLQLVRTACGKAYAHVSNDSLQRQMQTRRKIGAYAPPFDPKYPEWFVEHLAEPNMRKLRETILRNLGGCSLNDEHEVDDESDLSLVYRRFIDKNGESIIRSETAADVLLLCPECLKRSWLSLPSVPTQDLR